MDSSTGTLTIKKIGTATVIVTAEETSTYAQAIKEVTVTINKANAVAATVTANNLTYDGTEKPLVAVDNSTLVGGTMYYALGTAAEATQPYATSISTATDAGTYYVWYKVKGDENHNDREAACITVTLNKATAIASTVAANNRTYDGTEKALVTVDDSTLVGGTMWYALGENATTAPADNLYTTSIPAKTDAGI